MGKPDEDDVSHDDEQVRERSAEERNIVTPTPRDVRAKAEDDDEPEPPAADAQAP
ncbi:hypothetical protein AB0D10_30630 [Kitasatospora sp. NPDC048545]|uniref:hypothetical protein n=1 Tax=Kitasatospora sp. NPDC048545 TaxID=3157208 RepID=UPI0033D66A82